MGKSFNPVSGLEEFFQIHPGQNILDQTGSGSTTLQHPPKFVLSPPKTKNDDDNLQFYCCMGLRKKLFFRLSLMSESGLH